MTKHRECKAPTGHRSQTGILACPACGPRVRASIAPAPLPSVPKPKVMSPALTKVLAREAVNRDELVDPDELRFLAQSRSSSMRAMAARNPNTPLDVIKVLAFDSDEWVRLSIFRRNDVSFEDIRTAILAEKETQPWLVAAARDDFPVDLARELLADPEVSKRIKGALLARHPGLTREDVRPFAVATSRTEMAREATKHPSLLAEDLAAIAKMSADQLDKVSSKFDQSGQERWMAPASIHSLSDHLVAVAEHKSTDSATLSFIISKSLAATGPSADYSYKTTTGPLDPAIRHKNTAREDVERVIGELDANAFYDHMGFSLRTAVMSSAKLSDDEASDLAHRWNALDEAGCLSRFSDQWFDTNVLPLLRSPDRQVQRRINDALESRLARRLGVDEVNLRAMAKRLPRERLRDWTSLSPDDPDVMSARQEVDSAVRNTSMAEPGGGRVLEFRF